MFCASSSSTAIGRNRLLYCAVASTRITKQQQQQRELSSTQRLYLLLQKAIDLQLREQRQLATVKQHEQKVDAIRRKRIENYIEPKNTRHFRYHQGEMITRDQFNEHIEDLKFVPRPGSKYEVQYFSLHWSGQATVKWCVHVANLLGGPHDKTTSDHLVTRLVEQVWSEKTPTIGFPPTSTSSSSQNTNQLQQQKQRNNIKSPKNKDKKRQLAFDRMKQSLEEDHYTGFTDDQIWALVEAEEENQRNKGLQQKHQNAKDQKYSELVEQDRQFMTVLDVRNFFHQEHQKFVKLQEKGTAGHSVSTPVFYSTRSAELILNCFYRWVKYNKNKNNTTSSVSPHHQDKRELLLERAWAARALLAVITDCLTLETEYRQHLKTKLQQRNPVLSKNLIVTSQRILSWADNFNLSFVLTRCVSLLPFPTASIFDNEQALSFINQSLLLCSNDIDSTKQALAIHQELHKRRINIQELREKQAESLDSSVVTASSSASSSSGSLSLTDRSRQLLQENYVLPATSIMTQKFTGIMNILEMIYRESKRPKSEQQMISKQKSQTNNSSHEEKDLNEVTRENVLALVEKAIEVIISNSFSSSSSSSLAKSKTKMQLLDPFTKKQMTQIVLSLGFMHVFSPQLLVAFSPEIFTVEPRKGHHSEWASLEAQQHQKQQRLQKHKHGKNRHQTFTVYLPKFEAIIVSFVLGSASKMPFNPYDINHHNHHNKSIDSLNQKRIDLHRNKVDPFFREKVRALGKYIQEKARSKTSESNNNNNNNNKRPSFFGVTPKTEEVNVGFQFIQFFVKYYHGKEANDRVLATRRRGSTMISNTIEGFSEETFTQVFVLCNNCLVPTLKAGSNWLDLRDLVRVAQIGREFYNLNFASINNNKNNNNNDDDNDTDEKSSSDFLVHLNVLEQRLATKIHRAAKQVVIETKRRAQQPEKDNDLLKSASTSSTPSCFPFARSLRSDRNILLHVAPIVARWALTSTQQQQQMNFSNNNNNNNNNKNASTTKNDPTATTSTSATAAPVVSSKVLPYLIPLFVQQLLTIEEREEQQIHSSSTDCAISIAKELLLSQPPCSKLYSSFINHETVRGLISKEDEENLFAVVATMKKKSSKPISRERGGGGIEAEGKSTVKKSASTVDVYEQPLKEDDQDEADDSESYMDII